MIQEQLDFKDTRRFQRGACDVEQGPPVERPKKRPLAGILVQETIFHSLL
jgi:hypothetical protein